MKNDAMEYLEHFRGRAEFGPESRPARRGGHDELRHRDLGVVGLVGRAELAGRVGVGGLAVRFGLRDAGRVELLLASRKVCASERVGRHHHFLIV